MRNTIVRCSGCDRALALPAGPGPAILPCTRCGLNTRLWLFPALFETRKSAVAQQVIEEGHSSCMNHPAKRAVTVCDGCGKFLCALCDIDWNGDHLCSACIEHRKRTDTDNELRSEYVHYDRIVFALAIGSIFLYFLGVIMAPIALYVGWRYWNEPWRPVPYRKFGMIAALSLAFLILLGWGTLIVYFIINI